MFFYNVKHSAFIFLCILLTIYGCNNKNKKIIVENKAVIETPKTPDKYSSIDNIPKEKNIRKEIVTNDSNNLKNFDNENVIFEFRNERLLQGRKFPKNLEKKQTEKALSAVLKMFKRNLSSKNPELYLEKNGNISEFDGYFFEKNEISTYQNIIVLLPLTGQYSNYGNKIRKALDLSI